MGSGVTVLCVIVCVYVCVVCSALSSWIMVLREWCRVVVLVAACVCMCCIMCVGLSSCVRGVDVHWLWFVCSLVIVFRLMGCGVVAMCYCVCSLSRWCVWVMCYGVGVMASGVLYSWVIVMWVQTL